jgi:hypothetical protein
MSESWGNAIRSYAFAARSGRLPASALDARYLALCEGQVVAAGDDALDWSRKNAYATPFPLATKAVNGAGWYFSLDQASDMAVAYAIDPKPAYIDALVGAMNYEGGCNPVNVTYLTGLGSRRQREIVDQYAQNDRRVLPPSGIPIGNIQAGLPVHAELRVRAARGDLSRRQRRRGALSLLRPLERRLQRDHRVHRGEPGPQPPGAAFLAGRSQPPRVRPWSPPAR